MTETELMKLCDYLECNDASMEAQCEAAAELRRLHALNQELLEALKTAEASLSDIGDADREPGDDVAWCEARAAQALPKARAAIAKAEGEKQ